MKSGSRCRAIIGALLVASALSACQQPGGHPPAAPANGGNTSAPSDQSLAMVTTRTAVRLFLDVCMGGVTNEQRMVQALRALGFVEAPPAAAAAFLRGNAGTTWMRTDPPAVALPIVAVLCPGGVQCEVMARVTEPDMASALFEQMMQTVAGAPLVIRKERDERSALGGGPGRFMLFRLGVPSSQRGSYVAALSARPPVPGGIAMLMTVSQTSEVMR